MLKKLILLAGLVLVPSIAYSQQSPSRPIESCAQQAPYGWPVAQKDNAVLICRTAYALLHNNNVRVASWVVYTLTAENTTGCAPRVNAFAPDLSIPRGQRAELADYANSGFDTGHIANNADMSWDAAVARESFILSNMAPQLASLNRGAWRQLEAAVRSWAFNSRASVTIYSGSIYDERQDRRIGPNGVIVPNSFYKIVINNATRQSLAFLFPHVDVNDFRSVQTTVARVEEASGIRFSVPDDKNAMHRMWPVELTPMMNARRDRCRS